MTTPKPSTSSSSSSSTSEKGRNYDVFMNFRGEDTRKTFSSHLYEALDGKGIRTFKDDKNLKIGDEISVELEKAIEESKIFIVLLSKDYASSRWCLQELVKILECNKETKEQKIVPIFYEVDPSDVRNQRGSFHLALARHEENGRNVQRWKEALTEVANLSGYDSSKFESDAELIKGIVSEISTLITNHMPLFVAKHPVGIDSRVEEVISLLGVGDVVIIVIWGVGGIGKTTIANGVYNQIVGHFEGATFLPNVRERSTKPDGLLDLQRELLSEILRGSTWNDINNIDRGVNVIKHTLCNKRVLVVLDDVGHQEQLEKLVGEPNWFGSGSRIIITTRDEGLLKAMYGSNYKIYDVKILNYDEALELFSRYAFEENHPKSGFLQLSKKVVNYTGRLPLALKVLGSSLREGSTDEWISELDKLQRIPNNDIQEILKVSFDGLDRTQKEMFLDVAFFLKGGNINYATKILESLYGFNPAKVLKVLTQRSLITMDLYNALSMHDLVQEMAWEIVRQESPEEPGKRSRLSFNALGMHSLKKHYFHREVTQETDVHHVLKKATGTEAVKGISVRFFRPEEVIFSIKAFERMNALKLLVVEVYGDYNMHPSEDINYLSNELRFLKWHRYPSTSLPSSFHPTHLVELHLSESRIEQLWKTETSTLPNLKLLDLSDSQYLTKTPDLSAFPKLEELNLEWCSALVEVHPSSLVLNRLVCLNLNCCESLRRLWESIELKSLQRLLLSGCSKLEKLPEIRGTMEHLSSVDLSRTGIKELPSSIEHLTGLVSLDLANCKNLASLPSSIYKLKSLQTLVLSGCSKLESRPLSLLLPSLSGLSSLTLLNVCGCNLSDGAIPGISCLDLLQNLQKLNLSRNNFESPPEGLNRLARLKFIKFENCPRLRELPLLPTSIKNINAHGCRSLEKLRHPSNLENLDNPRVIFSDCQKLNTVIYLQRMHQVPCKGFEIFFSGSEIPEWFEHKSTESSISFDMSPLKFSKFRGVGLCAVFTPMETSIDNETYITCSLSDDGDGDDGDGAAHFMIPRKRYTGSDHVWLKFFKREELVNREVSQVSSDGLYHFEASFVTYGLYGNSHDPPLLKKCGVHLFHWEEEEIKHNIMFDDSDPHSEPYPEFHCPEYDNYSEEEEEEEEEERSGSECSENYSASGEEEIKHDSGEEEIKYDSDISSPYYSSGEGKEEGRKRKRKRRRIEVEVNGLING